MKKIFMSFAMALVAVCASAQVYVGGSVGIAGTKIGDGDRETTYKFLPEIGYQFADKWAVGVEFGWAKGNPVTIEGTSKFAKSFELNPYVRYTALKSKFVDVFIDGTVGYKHYNKVGEGYQFGLVPGVALNLNKTFSFIAKAGFVGYKTFDPVGDGKSSNAFGLDLDGNNLTFGLLVKF